MFDAGAGDGLAGAVLMVRPSGFGFNAETAGTNAFQRDDVAWDAVGGAVVREFDGVVGALEGAGVRVVVWEDRAGLPDAVFPNNWVTFHGDGEVAGGRVVLWPMMAASRRREVSRDVVAFVGRELGLGWGGEVDLTGLADAGVFCEGTGSLVLDRVGRVAYCGWSGRTSAAGVGSFCRVLGYGAVGFGAVDRGGVAVYHTNVMMALGGGFGVVCLDAVGNALERRLLVESIEASGREVIGITFEQMGAFGGNVLALRGRGGQVVVMSETARGALRGGVLERIERFGEVVVVEVGTIERVGGGGVRCMLAEVFGSARDGSER